MRAISSIPGLLVVAMATLVACAPADEPAATVLVSPGTAGPDQPAPESPLPTDPAKLEELLRSVEQLRSEQSASPIGLPRAAKLHFQCADDVAFAVRTIGGTLEVWPPGSPDNVVVLLPQSSEPGTHYYTADRAEFRFDGVFATLVLGPDRWVDCAANPAAAVWQAPPRGTR